MSVHVRVTREGAEPLVREFATTRTAAQYGVAYYLADNGYAPRPVAVRVANRFEQRGSAEHDGILFELVKS
jgi:hypothetical protein